MNSEKENKIISIVSMCGGAVVLLLFILRGAIDASLTGLFLVPAIEGIIAAFIGAFIFGGLATLILHFIRPKTK